MDATASSEVKTDYSLCDFIMKLEDAVYPSKIKQKHTVIKYTKIPEHDVAPDTVIWLHGKSNEPRIRRLVTVEEPEMKSSHSLNLESVVAYSKFTPSCSNTKRKIITIQEDDESNLYYAKDKNAMSSKCMSNKSVYTGKTNNDKPFRKQESRISPLGKKDLKPCAKLNQMKKEVDIPKANFSNRYPPKKEMGRSRLYKDPLENKRNADMCLKNNLSRNSKESEILLLQNELLKDFNLPSFDLKKQIPVRPKSPTIKKKVPKLKDVPIKGQSINLIHVPLEQKRNNESRYDSNKNFKKSKNYIKETFKDFGTENMYSKDNFKDVNVETDPSPKKESKLTETDEIENKASYSHKIEKQSREVQADFDGNINKFEKLHIPNVKLTKEKSDRTDEKTVSLLSSNSLPNLQISHKTMSKNKDVINESDTIQLTSNHSYIIGRATVTYTTKQKIDFQVLGSKESTISDISSPITTYPMNVVSVFKKEMKRQKHDIKKTFSDITPEILYKNNIENKNNITSFNCSFTHIDSTKLVKPSEIINSIKHDNGSLFDDIVSEQFQKELNFIDSFFETLQYLDNCTSTSKEDNSAPIVDPYEKLMQNSLWELDSPEYNTLLSKFEHTGTETQTVASKSLSLLNLLIRDEQRRARNLLFVLKMREDALKDFTKSQILWLENKKKLENTDVSILKKKQRGALLKWQHECGEMQRMRKALLTLSEKRKAALIKTKRNLELKLTDNVNVDKILSNGKRKLRRAPSIDRSMVPLKCFELSVSSGYEDVIPKRQTNETFGSSAEKCIQTSDCIIGNLLVDCATDTAAENFVVVDGGYLNILFHNLALPQIFSGGKQYEVNEEALKNILNSANTLRNNINDNNVIEKLMEHLKNFDDLSSPSTARSLVEEFDQYYKGLVDVDESKDSSTPDQEKNYEQLDSTHVITEMNEIAVDAYESPESHIISKLEQFSGEETVLLHDLIIDNLANKKREQLVNTKDPYICETAQVTSLQIQSENHSNIISALTSQVGTITVEPPILFELSTKSSINHSWQPVSVNTSSIVSTDSTSDATGNMNRSSQYCTPVSSLNSVSEAEELRRQQLAIEREIKALEQQQSQLLVVREIPDKPPPPYTPPAEPRPSKTVCRFVPDDNFEIKIHQVFSGKLEISTENPFDEYLKDFCFENQQRQQSDESDKPWDSCNVLPKKYDADHVSVEKKTAIELRDVLTGLPPGMVNDLGGRRADHIDDILFSEWRRCEPEWTSLHVDEVVVKNQVFESIFQMVLSKTIDEYKKIVIGNDADDD